MNRMIDTLKLAVTCLDVGPSVAFASPCTVKAFKDMYRQIFLDPIVFETRSDMVVYEHSSLLGSVILIFH